MPSDRRLGWTRSRRRLAQLRAHAARGGSEEQRPDKPVKSEAPSPENPVPFAGLVEANSQHLGGIAVLEGAASRGRRGHLKAPLSILCMENRE